MSRRYFDTDYWNGKYVRSLSMTENYLYLYLLLNPDTNIAGIFDDQPDLFSFRTKIPQPEVERVLAKLEADGKLVRLREDDRIAMTKHGKHQTKSPDVASGIARVLAALSGEGLQTLMTPSPQGAYTLPPGCTWKTMEKLIKSYREADNEKIEGEGVGRVMGGSYDPHAPNLTLPNPTTLGGGGGLVRRGAEPPAGAPASRSVVLTEDQLCDLDREFPGIDIDGEYEKVSANGRIRVSDPMAFMRARFEKISGTSRKGAL